MNNMFTVMKYTMKEMIRRKSEICKFKTYELEEMIIKYTLKAEKEARKRALVLN